ncbi:MAG: pectin acetylesterase-family hydrolase [Myxococcota bacterium]
MIALLLAACGTRPEPPAPAPAALPVPVPVQPSTPVPVGEVAERDRPVMVKPAERDPRWAAARCNDGTPFGYVIRRGASPTWVIHLSGGFYCDDETQLCRDRKPRLITTRPEADGGPARIKLGGVLSPDPTVNPTFATASHVDAHYCSSDLWLGDRTDRRPNTADPVGWYFSGRENVRVLFEALRDLDGLREADPATRILVMGSSAGGIGLVGNLDAVVAALPHAVSDGRVKVLIDGGWVPDVPPFVAGALPDVDRWGPVLPACDRDLRAADVDPARCVEGSRWWPYAARLGIPVLVQISGLDTSQTPAFGIDTAAEAAAWRDQVRASLAGVPRVFSGGLPYHVIGADDAGLDLGPPGSTFREVLDRFWAGGPPERVIF